MAIDGNQPAIEFRKRRFIHARLVIEAIQERVAGKFQKIAPTIKVLRKQYQVKPAINNARMGTVAAITWCNVRLDTKNRLDALLARLKPGAVLMLRDPSGMELYRIAPAVQE